MHDSSSNTILISMSEEEEITEYLQKLHRDRHTPYWLVKELNIITNFTITISWGYALFAKYIGEPVSQGGLVLPSSLDCPDFPK